MKKDKQQGWILTAQGKKILVAKAIEIFDNKILRDSVIRDLNKPDTNFDRYVYSRIYDHLIKKKHKKDYINIDTFKAILRETRPCSLDSFKDLFNLFDCSLIEGLDIIQTDKNEQQKIQHNIRYIRCISQNYTFCNTRKPELDQIIEIVESDVNPHTVIINGENGIGKYCLALEVASHYSRKTNRPVFNRIICTTFAKDDKVSGLRHFYADVFDTLNKEAILRTELKQQEQKVVEALKEKRNRNLILLLNFHNLPPNQQQEVKNFFTKELPRNCIVIVTTSEEISENSFDSVRSIITLNPLNEEQALSFIKHELQKTNFELSQAQKDIVVANSRGIPQYIFVLIEIMRKNKELLLKNSNCGLDSNFMFELCSKYVDLFKYKDSYFLLFAAFTFSHSFTRDAIAEIAFSNQISDLRIKKAINELIASHLFFPIEGERLILLFFMRPYISQYIDNKVEELGSLKEDMLERSFEYYIEFTRKYGGDDIGNWYFNYSKINAEWRNIIALIESGKKHPQYFDKVESLWLNVNHFADLNGKWSDRIDCLEFLLKQYKQNPSANRARCQSSLAWTYTMMGGKEDYQHAEKLLLEIIKDESVSKKDKDRAYHNLFTLRIHQKDYVEARKVFEAKKAIYDLLKENNKVNPRREINHLRDEGKLLFKEEKDLEASRNFYFDCISIAENIRWNRMISYSYYMLARIELKMGEYDDVERYIEYGLFIARKNFNDRRIAFLTMIKGQLALYLSRPPSEVEPLRRKANEMFKKLGMENAIIIFDEEWKLLTSNIKSRKTEILYQYIKT